MDIRVKWIMDINGFRIYLKKYNGNNNCYNDNYINNQLNNIQLRVTFLGLNVNIFNLGDSSLDYQMFSKACRVSISLLKKIYFKFSIGRFY